MHKGNNRFSKFEKIKHAFAELNITGYYFAPVINTHSREQELSRKILDRATISIGKSEKSDLSMIHFSDKNVKNCFQVFKKFFAKDDPAFAEMSKMKLKTKVFLKHHPASDWEQQWYATMEKHGYRSRGVSIFELKCAKPLLGALIFFSDKAPEELATIIESSDKFTTIADSLAELIVTSLNTQANPWVALGALSNNSHKILMLLADGLDTEQIAHTMSLTRRGIDYHVDVMKELMQAKNRTHLVSKAFREGVIK